MRALRLLLTLIVLGAWVSGCTLTRFGYDMLPWLSMWQLDRHLDLDDAQRHLASKKLDALLAWHRQTQLPDYVRLLREAETQLGGAVEAQDIGRWRARVFELWNPVVDRLAPDLADLALTLRPAQIDRLDKRLSEGAHDLRRKYLEPGPQRRIEARAERWQERMDGFLGEVTSAQARELRRLAERYPSDEASWVEEREARGRDLVRLLRRIEHDKPSRERAIDWCRVYLADLWRSADQARRQRIEANNANGDRLVAMMIQGASRSQRAHLLHKLRGYEDDFARLSGQIPRRP